MIDLYPDQQIVLDDVRESLRRVRRTLLAAATGFGKTVVLARIARAYHDAGKRVTIGVGRKELVDQISDTLRRTGVPHGIIAAEYEEDARYGVQVASVPTLARRLDRTPEPHLLIADEAHHCTLRSQWGAILTTWNRARHFGVTATPERLDGQPLGDAFDELVVGPQTHDLIPLGRLSDYTLFGPPDGSGIDVSGLRKRGGDYERGAVEERADRPKIVGDAVAEYARHCPGAPAIVRGVSVKHSQHLAEAFRLAGFQAAHIDGTTPRAERARMVDDFRRGVLRLLCNVSLFSEGFDVPGVVAVIDEWPTESLTLARQFWGRVFRVFAGKERGFIFDHAGNFRRHGLPDDERGWSLTGESKPIKPKDPNDVAIRQCRCGAVNRASASECRDCGTPFSMQARPRIVPRVAGDLVEVSKAEHRAAVVAARTAAEAMAMEKARANHLAVARAERQALQAELMQAEAKLWKLTGRPIRPLTELERMKPAMLRSELDRIAGTVRAIIIDQRQRATGA